MGAPVGRLVAIHHGEWKAEAQEALVLESGSLREGLAIDGEWLAGLVTGTRLRLGTAVVVEVTGVAGLEAEETRGGLVDATTGARVGARVLAGGTVHVGDGVVIEAVPVPLEEMLDLHSFRPEEAAAVVGEYLDQAHAAGFEEVRIVHGRGRGVQRETVRRLLAGSALVATFGDAPPERGGWGATIVRLRRRSEYRRV